MRPRAGESKKYLLSRALGSELCKEHDELKALLESGERLPPTEVGEHIRKMLSRLFYKYFPGRDQQADALEMEKMLFRSMDALALYRAEPVQLRPKRKAAQHQEQMDLGLNKAA
jgi:hypothetical protein